MQRTVFAGFEIRKMIKAGCLLGMRLQGMVVSRIDGMLESAALLSYPV
jgi:hypothetical protein